MAEMISVSKNFTAAGTEVIFSGSIEEQTDFQAQVGEIRGSLTVNCSGITRINSVGVKAWIVYFQGMHSSGTKVTFTECSPAIVNQLNMISNFTGGGDVHSILLPYACSLCGKEFMSPIEIKTLLKTDKQITVLKCEKTGCQATFDDEPDYLYFLN